MGKIKQKDWTEVVFNEKECIVVKHLLDAGGPHRHKDDMVAHVKDIAKSMPLLPSECYEGTTESKAVRWVLNSVRKLYRLRLVDRVDRGTYQLIKPNRAAKMLAESLTHLDVVSERKTWTADSLSDLLKDDYPTKAARARRVGIERRRWGRLEDGAEPNAAETKLMQKCGREESRGK